MKIHCHITGICEPPMSSSLFSVIFSWFSKVLLFRFVTTINSPNLYATWYFLFMYHLRSNDKNCLEFPFNNMYIQAHINKTFSILERGVWKAPPPPKSWLPMGWRMQLFCWQAKKGSSPKRGAITSITTPPPPIQTDLTLKQVQESSQWQYPISNNVFVQYLHRSHRFERGQIGISLSHHIAEHVQQPSQQ